MGGEGRGGERRGEKGKGGEGTAPFRKFLDPLLVNVYYSS